MRAQAHVRIIMTTIRNAKACSDLTACAIGLGPDDDPVRAAKFIAKRTASDGPCDPGNVAHNWHIFLTGQAPPSLGAGGGNRTRDIQLGKLSFYH